MGEMQRIEEQLLPDGAGEHIEGFIINSLDTAEWCLRKISRAEARIQERNDCAAKIKAEIDARLEAINAKDLDTVAYLGSLLRPWAEVEIAKAGKAKSVKLLAGEVGFRKAPDSLEVTDEAAALAWLKEHYPQGVRTVESVDKKKVKEAIEFNGEVPDGCELRRGDIKFYVRAGMNEVGSDERKEVT